VPTGNTLSITLNNSLPVETSLTIVGLVGTGSTTNGVGNPVRELTPRDHPTQTETTWILNGGATFTPPAQGLRARSFAQEASANGGTVMYSWSALKPGTYLIESGTYPSIQGPMGLYGILVVTTEATLNSSPTSFTPGPGTAYPGIGYDADIPLLLSEIDPVQNATVEQFLEAVALCPTATPGTGACTGSIDAPHATAKWTQACGAAHTCYPAAVNFTPLYYMVNGISFDKTAITSSAAPIPSSASTGNVLLRFVNAGLRMHMPAVTGLSMSLIAEDGNVLPDVALAASASKPLAVRVQSDVFLPAGKVYDVLVSPATTTTTGPPAVTTFNQGAYQVFDRELSLSANASRHDSGMQTTLLVAGGQTVAATSGVTAKANADTYYLVAGKTLTVSDPGKGVLANDVNIYGAQVLHAPSNGTVTLNPDGTFVYVPSSATVANDMFTYYGNNNNTAAALQATVTIAPCTTGNTCLGNAPIAGNGSYNSNVSSLIKINAPGVLAFAKDPLGLPLTPSLVSPPAGVSLNPDGGFTVARPNVTTSGTLIFQYQVVNSQGTGSSMPGTITINFPAGSGLAVTVQDANTKLAIADYKWIMERDLTFHIDPASQVNVGPCTSPGVPAGCGTPPTLGTNFNTSYMPVIAAGCTGTQSCEQAQTVYDNNPSSPTYKQHVPAICDGSGICVPAPAGSSLPVSTPAQVQLLATDTTGVQCTALNTPAGCNPLYGQPVYYYLSILPGDVSNPFNTGNGSDPTVSGNCDTSGTATTPTGVAVASTCGHTMGGAPIAPGQTAVIVNVEPNPLPTATVTVFVFEDDWPLNGEPDAGGGIPDTLMTNEPALEDFQVELWDDAGGSGDATGQMTYDMFNEPLTNALNGTLDPVSGLDACPISNAQGLPAQSNAIVGVIVVCPRYESDGKTLSPLTGQAVIRNLMPGRFGIIVHPGAAREARGEEWLQTNTLDGTHFLDSFVKAAEPAYFQEFGPGGFHVFMGMANPKMINARLNGICHGNANGAAPPGTPFAPPCNNTVQGQVTNLHQSRSPNESLFESGVYPQGDPHNYAPLSYTSCYASLGDPDGATIAFTKCDQDGNFTFSGVPAGTYGLVVFDQWLDLIVDGSSKTVNVPFSTTGSTVNIDYAAFSWQAHLWNREYLDLGGLGTPVLLPDGSLDPAKSPGLIQILSKIRMRNGKPNNTTLTDIGGNADFNETFPLFSWYVVESDNTRFRNTGVHVVNDAGGQLDGPSSGCFSATLSGGSGTCGNGITSPYQGILNSNELDSVPPNLRVPGAVYCSKGDPQCASTNFFTNPNGNASSAPTTGLSTGRIDPGSVVMEGWQGGLSEYDIIDWGKQPYVTGETGGIRGHVVYASTRPFDDVSQETQNIWEPLVPNVTVNLYKEGTALDGTQTLTLVDTTTTSSWDAWAQGFNATTGLPNVSCPGQDASDFFYSYTLQNTTNYLNPGVALPYQSQYKCYDGYHNLNQVQPAPYDGLYQFPSPACAAAAGATFTAPSGQSVTCATKSNPAYPNGTVIGGVRQMGAAPAALPAGKYVVEVITPPNYELVKEEDKNILMGDNFIAPVTQQFGAISNIFIVPDQATINNANSSYTGPTTAPTISITGGGGSGASAVSSVDGTTGAVTGISVATAGSGYTSAPTITIVDILGGLGTGATATATVSGGSVTAITVKSPGTGYGIFNYALQNNSNPTTDLGHPLPSTFTPGALVMSFPCVGALRIVPDFMSISPESGEVAPFAGASRHLCDRREITLEDQMQAQSDFFVWTKTPAAAHYTGFITDDFSSEFDPASPAFGEKFAVPNVPVSIRDYNGVETSRVYSDQWGSFNGLVYSTFDVDPPNPTGYAPGMMITCMNDPGPIPGPSGTMTNDPLYNPAYSNFCYENPFMPQDTQYLDTPVVPTSAFAEGYNPPDCAYPDATPAISQVNGNTGKAGPYIDSSQNNANSEVDVMTLTITALGDQRVLNPAYSGPAATTAPYNQKFITRHYGFGNTTGTVDLLPATKLPVHLTINSWSDTTITATVPLRMSEAGNPNDPPARLLCAGPTTTPSLLWNSYCGELAITAANGRKSIDTVTVTIENSTSTGYRAPTYVAGENGANNAIQSVIDAATPGDLIMVAPGFYNEMLLMWKPVRLQGVGAASVTVNANAHPAGKLLQPWRREVNCLFGLAVNGGINGAINPVTGQPAPFDPSGTFTCAANMQFQIDRMPGEGVVGWDATLNGNLAELLQEPSLMGAYEGAAITVLGKGVRIPAGAADPFGAGAEAFFPAGTVLLTNSAADCTDFPSNFHCRPSRIDGITFTNSSQGGGGIYLHGWDHNLVVANTRVNGNGGTLTGGITVGYPEAPDADAGRVDGTSLIDAFNVEQPYRYNENVQVHHNSITSNAAFGDELGSATPAAAGGVTICTGADNYSFSYNWVCGNLSSGSGGGLAHFGFSYNGDIEHNSFVFNQSFNPTLTTYGGGVIAEGMAPDGSINGVECGNLIEVDCPPALSDGIGPNLTINANLFQGNTAESGSGGGLRLQHVNGTEVQRNPGNPNKWYAVNVTNNIFTGNVAGWAGGGVALLDAVNVNFVNNTVVSNDTTASAGVLFDTSGASGSAVAPPGCNPTTGVGCTNPITTSHYEPAGLETEAHSLLLSPAFTVPVICPPGHPQCTQFSNPVLDNNLFWQNRAFYIAPGGNPIPGLTNVFTLQPALSQGTTGACPSGAYYWDIGVYGDTAPNDHSSTLTLNPLYSFLTSTSGYSSTNQAPANPGVVSQFCNGSRVPPEIASTLCTSLNAQGCAGAGQNGGASTPPGVPDINPFYPQFSLMPAATVDEGNNFINMFYGPLTLSNPTIASGATGYGAPLGNLELTMGSPAIDYISIASPTYPITPRLDFFGNPRPDPANPFAFDVGAVEFTRDAEFVLAPTSLTFSSSMNVTSAPQTVTVDNTGDVPLTLAITFGGQNPMQFGQTNTCAPSVPAGGHCAINVTFTPTMASPNPKHALLNVNGGAGSGGTQSVSLTGNIVVPTYMVSPTSLAFLNQLIGTTSVAKSVTITNTSTNGAYLAISAPTKGGTNPGQWGTPNTNCPANLAPTAGSNTCTVSINFAPTTTAAKSATLNINVGAPASPTQTQVALTGTGTQGAISFSPSPVAFGARANGSTTTITVTVSNSSSAATGAPITISAVATGGSSTLGIAAGTNNCTGKTLSPGGTCTVGVSFKPTSTTSVNGTLSVTDTGVSSGGGSTTQTDNLSGS